MASRCLQGKGLGKPVAWSLAGLLDLEGILGPARIRPGHPPGLFLFANLSPAGLGGRWDCGRGEEQQVVSNGGLCCAEAVGDRESRVVAAQLGGSSRGWGGTARISYQASLL